MLPIPPCPTRDQIEAFVAGTLSEEEDDWVGTHLDCPDCRAAFAAARKALSVPTAVAPPGPPAGAGGPPASPPPELPEPYTDLTEVAVHGMGTVYRAVDTRVGRPVAIKVLNPALFGLDNRYQFYARFAGECDRMARCQHTNIPDIYDRGRVEADGRPFLVMPWIGGGSLRQRLERSRPRRPLEAKDLGVLLGWFVQVCGAVGYAHERHIVHLDIKPDNILLGDGGDAYLIDWGLSRRYPPGLQEPPEPGAAPDDAGLGSEPEDLLGTDGYMSPEQADDDRTRLGPRMDVFALGSLLAFLLTGERAYRGPETRTADMAATRARLDALADVRELADLTWRCLSDDPTRRPADARALLAEYHRIQDESAARARRAEVERVKAEAEADTLRARYRSRLWTTAAVMAAAVGLLATGVGVVTAARDWDATEPDEVKKFLARARVESAGNGSEGHPGQRGRAVDALRDVQALFPEALVGMGPRAPDGNPKHALYARLVRLLGRSGRVEERRAEVVRVHDEIGRRLDQVGRTRAFHDAVDLARVRTLFDLGTARAARLGSRDERRRSRAFLAAFTHLGLSTDDADFARKLEAAVGSPDGPDRASRGAAIVALDWAYLTDPGPGTKKLLEVAQRLDTDDEGRRWVREWLLAGPKAAAGQWAWLSNRPEQPRPGQPRLGPEASLFLVGARTSESVPQNVAEVLQSVLNDNPERGAAHGQDAFTWFWVELTLGVYHLTGKNFEARLASDEWFAGALRLIPGPERGAPAAPAQDCETVLRQTAAQWMIAARLLTAHPGNAYDDVRRHAEVYRRSDVLAEWHLVLLIDRGALAEAAAVADRWCQRAPGALVPQAYLRVVAIRSAPADRAAAAREDARQWFEAAARTHDAAEADHAGLALAGVGAVPYRVPADLDLSRVPAAYLGLVLTYQHHVDSTPARPAALPPRIADLDDGWAQKSLSPPASRGLTDFDRPVQLLPWCVSLRRCALKKREEAKWYGEVATGAAEIARWVTGDVRRACQAQQARMLIQATVQAPEDGKPVEEAFPSLKETGALYDQLGEVIKCRNNIKLLLPPHGRDDDDYKLVADCQRAGVAAAHPRPGCAWLAVGFARQFVDTVGADDALACNPFAVLRVSDVPGGRVAVNRCLLLVTCGYKDCPGGWLKPEAHNRARQAALTYLSDVTQAPTDDGRREELRALQNDPVLINVRDRLHGGDRSLIETLGGPEQVERWRACLSAVFAAQ